MFSDRKEAGKKLADLLSIYSDSDALVAGIAKGGVEVAYEAAKNLNCDFCILISRKLPLPENPEAGFGAVAEDGSKYLHPQVSVWMSEIVRQEVLQDQLEEIQRRIRLLRGGEHFPDITNRRVIIIDDGIAMGSTMMASIKMCRRCDAGEVIAAVPVAGIESAHLIGSYADRLFVVEKPLYFRAVAEFYEKWYDVGDEQVIGLLKRYKKQRQGWAQHGKAAG